MLTKGLNNFQLKMIALICMVFDHLHYVLGAQLGIPYWFGIIGRIAAPIFIYMTACGMGYTRSRFKYVSRLYIASVLMGIANIFVNMYLPHPEGAMIINNIFATMFLITLYIVVIEGFIKSIKEKAILKGIGYLTVSSLPILSVFLMYWVFEHGSLFAIRAILTFIPNIMTVEGGFVWVIMGVGFYFVRNSKKLTSLFFTVGTAALFFLLARGDFSFTNLFVLNYQWLMILALPLILLYNNQKGRSSKWFFYIFYPAHVYILLIISRFIAS